MLVRMRRKGNPLALLVGTQTGAATLENSMAIPQKIKNRTTLQPGNYTIRYLSKRYKHADLKGPTHPNVYSSTSNNSQSMERPKFPLSGEWIKKMWGVCACVCACVCVCVYGMLLGDEEE